MYENIFRMFEANFNFSICCIICKQAITYFAGTMREFSNVFGCVIATIATEYISGI